MSDFELQRKLVATIREHPAVLNALNNLLRDRLDVRREQQDGAMGEPAVVLRGHVRELKSLLDDLNSEPRKLAPLQPWKGETP